MTTDTAPDECARWHLCADVVRTPAAEVRRASHGQRNEISRRARLAGRTDRREAIVADALRETRSKRPDDGIGVQRTVGREQPVTTFIGLAGDHGMVRTAPQRILDQRFERRVLVLDDEHFRQSCREASKQTVVDG